MYRDLRAFFFFLPPAKLAIPHPAVVGQRRTRSPFMVFTARQAANSKPPLRPAKESNGARPVARPIKDSHGSRAAVHPTKLHGRQAAAAAQPPIRRLAARPTLPQPAPRIPVARPSRLVPGTSDRHSSPAQPRPASPASPANSQSASGARRLAHTATLEPVCGGRAHTLAIDKAMVVEFNSITNWDSSFPNSMLVPMWRPRPMWPASAAQAADRAGQCYPSGRLNETVRGSRQPGARSAAERGLRSATQLARGSEPPCSPTYRLIGEKLKPASMLALPCLTCVPLQVPGRTLSHRAATARAALPAPPPTRVPRGGVLSGCVAVLWARTGRRRARRSRRTPSACPRRMAAGDRGPSAAARRT
jgi:hypothetical protein